MASASAASSVFGSAFGSSTPIIMRICAFSAWPAPTMVFFTRLGAYSATGRPGARRDQHRDAARLAELERRVGVLVDEGRFDRGLVRRVLLDDAHEPVMDRDEPHRQVRRRRWYRPNRRRRKSAGCPRIRSGPSRCGGGPDRCRECESPACSCLVDTRDAQSRLGSRRDGRCKMVAAAAKTALP